MAKFLSAASPLLTPLRRWIPQVAHFLSLQAAGQLLGFLTGLVAVRLLAVHGFGKYSISLAVQGTAAILADVGVSSAVSALGARHCENPERFGDLIGCALAFRRRLEIAALLVAEPLLVYLLLHAGASRLEVVVAAASLVIAVHGQVTIGVFSVVPLLKLRFQDVQMVNVAGSTFRFLSIGLSLWLTRNYLWAVVLMSGSSWLQGRLMGWVARRFIAGDMISREDDHRAISKIFRSQIVAALYYAFEPQMTLLLITIFGNVERVAEIGALGRLTIIFMALNGILSNLIAPRFARIQGHAALLRRYLQTVSVTAAFGAMFVFVTAIIPHQILWLIGPKYAHLSNELVLMVAFSVFNLLTLAMATLNVSRAWNRGSWICAPCALVIQFFLLHFLNLSTVRGAILFGWGALAASFATSAFLSLRGLRQVRAEEQLMKPLLPSF